MPVHKLRSPLILESGDTLFNPQVFYRKFGEFNRSKDNVILFCHTLLGGVDLLADDKCWFIGPGKFLDTSHYCVLAFSNLGTPFGSSSPITNTTDQSSHCPLYFPLITIRDSVRAHLQVIHDLGIESIYCVTGGSFGGFKVYTFITESPNLFRNAIVFQSDIKVSVFSIAAFALCKDLITSDPVWAQGNYQPEQISQMSSIQRVLYLNRLCQVSCQRFDTSLSDSYTSWFNSLSAQYVENVGRASHWILKPSLWPRMDPNCLIVTLTSSSLFNLSFSYPDFLDRWSSLTANVFHIPCEEDVEYYPSKAKAIHSLMAESRVNTYFYSTSSMEAHGSFLSDPKSMIGAFDFIQPLMQP
jgi:homoserine O-acetyltransferase